MSDTSSQTGQSPDLRDFVYVGFNSRVAALNRETGEVAWSWHAPYGRCGHVAVLLDNDRLVVSVHGHTYGIDALSGTQLSRQARRRCTRPCRSGRWRSCSRWIVASF